MVQLNTIRTLFLQSIRCQMRVPSIKFRKGGVASSASAAPGAAPAQQAKSAQPQARVVLEDIPPRFKRRPISDEEVEYINRGGPA